MDLPESQELLPRSAPTIERSDLASRLRKCFKAPKSPFRKGGKIRALFKRAKKKSQGPDLIDTEISAPDESTPLLGEATVSLEESAAMTRSQPILIPKRPRNQPRESTRPSPSESREKTRAIISRDDEEDEAFLPFNMTLG